MYRINRIRAEIYQAGNLCAKGSQDIEINTDNIDEPRQYVIQRIKEKAHQEDIDVRIFFEYDTL